MSTRHPPRVAQQLYATLLKRADRDYVLGDLNEEFFRHVLPQTTSVVLTQAALLVPQFILAEVTLSFLGLGLSPPTPSWGLMLAAAQKLDVISVPYWWMLSPAAILVLLFVAYHGLARALQPRES